MEHKKFSSVDEYLRSLPDPVREAVAQVRRTVIAAAPGGQETISYNIPTLRLNGRSIVSYAGWAGYLSLYPVPAGDAAFADEIASFRSGKSTARFPLDAPIPHELIARMVRFLVVERG